MIKEVNILEASVAKEMLEMQKEAYEVEAKLIGSREIPPLKETLDDLMACGEQFFGYYIEKELAGAISFKSTPEEIDIHRVMVSPKHFRKGIGRKLVIYLEERFKNKNLIVSTGAKNQPAVQLYTQLGFVKVGEQEVGNGLILAHFQKEKVNDD